MASPTAQISFAELPRIEVSSFDPAPRFGLLTTDQILPFQCSMRLRPAVPLKKSLPPLPPVPPVAVQDFVVDLVFQQTDFAAGSKVRTI